MNPTGLPLRLQAQIPSTRRDFRTLLENIAGNVVNGKVHPPRLVTGVPSQATADWGPIKVASKYAGDEWNGWTLDLKTNDAAGEYALLNFDTKQVIVYYTAATTTLALLDAALAISTPFYVTTFDSADTTKVDDALGDFTITPTTSGSDIICFPAATKDFIRIIQNCGTNAVKILYSNSGHASADQFHQILTACTEADDGTGGNVQVLVPERVTAIGADGNAVRLAITRIESPEAI